ncbi:CNIH4 protein, partial [Eolophus roseicapillus]|nr:CNIH4 protein [Eolophus roseicapilla]
IITLSDLECDYINARSCCSKLNKVNYSSLHFMWFKKMALHFSIANSRGVMYIMVPCGNMGVFDPTEIHNRGQLKSHMKEAMIKLGFHLLCFFMYLYRLVAKIAPK